MTYCKNCVDEYGYIHDKVTKVQMVYAYDGPRSFCYCVCKQCGRMTEPCLTREEAKLRMQAGWYISHTVETTDSAMLESSHAKEGRKNGVEDALRR